MCCEMRRCLLLILLYVIGSCPIRAYPSKPNARYPSELKYLKDLIEGLFRSSEQGVPHDPVPVHCGRSRYHSEHHANYGLDETSGAENIVEKRIVGGKTSQSGEWPWLVTLQLTKNGTHFEHLCGGSLIDRQWVLSAAHCFEDIWADFLTDDPSSWKVRVGEHNMFEEDQTQLDINVDRILFHPQRDPEKSADMDIVLIKLAKPVQLNSAVNVVCLPSTTDQFPVDTVCLTAGWGHTEEDGAISSVVNHVSVPILNSSLCREIYGPVYATEMNLQIGNDMMCAGRQKGGIDACQYDSGGPMVHYDHGDEHWILVGIVSLGYGCARPGFPGIYTEVSKYVTWIESTIATN